MKIIIKKNLQDSVDQLTKLNDKISDTINNSGTLTYTLVDGTEFMNEFANYNLLDGLYKNSKSNSRVLRKERYIINEKMKKKSQEISQFLKVRNYKNPRKLEEWGIIIVSVDEHGRVEIPRRLVELEIMYKGIIDKHTLDGASSILSVFDMTEFETEYNDLMNSKTLYEAEKLVWRINTGKKRQSFDLLVDDQRLIAKEMYTHPDYSKRDLELWGYEVLEFHNRN